MNLPRMSSNLEQLLKKKEITLVPHDAGTPRRAIPTVLMYRNSDLGMPIGHVAELGGDMWLPYFNQQEVSKALRFEAAVLAVLAYV